MWLGKAKIGQKVPGHADFWHKKFPWSSTRPTSPASKLFFSRRNLFGRRPFVLKSLDALRRDHGIVLGEASPISVANGGILANKNSWFLKRWFQQYQSFDDSLLGANSVQTALALWQLFPEEVEVVQVRMFRSNWMEYHMLLHGLVDWSDNWTVHLPTRKFVQLDKKRTLSQFARLRTSYGEIARFVFWGSPDLEDVKDWILHPDFDNV